MSGFVKNRARCTCLLSKRKARESYGKGLGEGGRARREVDTCPAAGACRGAKSRLCSKDKAHPGEPDRREKT